jgi:hypothetical protein
MDRLLADSAVLSKVTSLLQVPVEKVEERLTQTLGQVKELRLQINQFKKKEHGDVASKKK